MEIQENKKAIFLVEDFNEDGPVTLLEKVFEPLIKKLKEEDNIALAWLSEVKRMLYRYPDDTITFVKAADFIQNINNGSLPEDLDVYYFIACYQNLDTFNFSYFLAIDTNTVDFLVKHKIPVIIDCSMEISDNYYRLSNILLDNDYISPNNKTDKDLTQIYYRGISSLEFYLVGSMHYPDPNENSTDPLIRKTRVYHGYFPGCFFVQNTHDDHLNRQLLKNRDSYIEKIKNRQVTKDTLVWQSFSNQPRFSRSLFQLKVDYEESVARCGRYSRLKPAAEDTKHWYYSVLGEDDIANMPYARYNNLDALNEIKIIDSDKFNNYNHDFIDRFDSMIWIVLETTYMIRTTLFSNTASMVTEKCMQPIISGHPFIPVGGQKIGEILSFYGFKPYDKLIWPTAPNYRHELDQVIDSIRYVNRLDLNKKRDLYESWKDTAIFNLNLYIDINVQEFYLKNLREMKARGT